MTKTGNHKHPMFPWAVIATAVSLAFAIFSSTALLSRNTAFAGKGGPIVHQVYGGSGRPAPQPPTSSDRQCCLLYDKFDVEYNVTYGFGTCIDEFGQPYQKELKLDAYCPSNNPSMNKPALVIIHGAAWGVSGIDKNYFPFVEAAKHFASLGAVCFSIDYRVGTDNPDAYGINEWQVSQRASYVDAKAAVRWIRAHAGDYGIDPDCIASYGGSSGAGSAIMLAITDPNDFSTDYPGGQIPFENHPFEDPGVQACIEFWGSCFKLIAGIPPVPYLFGFEEEFDPADPPIMITHGTEDHVFYFEHAEAMESLCILNGIYCKMVILQGEGHGAWSAHWPGHSPHAFGVGPGPNGR